MNLGDFIKFLESQPQEMVVKNGLGSPHSYRANYCDLAFEEVGETTIGAMLKMARSCVDKEFVGYKGGEFRMHEYTAIHIANYGHSGAGEWGWAMQWMISNKQ